MLWFVSVVGAVVVVVDVCSRCHVVVVPIVVLGRWVLDVGVLGFVGGVVALFCCC